MWRSQVDKPGIYLLESTREIHAALDARVLALVLLCRLEFISHSCRPSCKVTDLTVSMVALVLKSRVLGNVCWAVYLYATATHP